MTPRKWVKGIGLAVLLIASTVMLAQDIITNHMPGADFSKYHTYKWVNIEGGEQPNQIVDAEIRQAVDSQLAAKGLTKVESGDADLLVAYQTAVNQQKQWTG